MFRPLSLIAWLGLCGCGQADQGSQSDGDRATLGEQYVSITCPAGDITLTLNDDHTFELSISFWDETKQAHSGQEAVSGRWIKYDKVLMLVTSEGDEVRYDQNLTAMGVGNAKADVMTYRFKSSQQDFFATGFDLLEKGAVDDVLRKGVTGG